MTYRKKTPQDFVLDALNLLREACDRLSCDQLELFNKTKEYNEALAKLWFGDNVSFDQVTSTLTAIKLSYTSNSLARNAKRVPKVRVKLDGLTDEEQQVWDKHMQKLAYLNRAQELDYRMVNSLHHPDYDNLDYASVGLQLTTRDQYMSATNEWREQARAWAEDIHKKWEDEEIIRRSNENESDEEWTGFNPES